MVTLTESAADRVRALLVEQTEGLNALRLYTKPGGCTGFSYGMALDVQKEDDLVFEMHGVHLVVDPESLELVDGSQVDYIDDLTGQGFQIHNPNATSMCGCGSSFRTETNAGQPGSCE